MFDFAPNLKKTDQIALQKAVIERFEQEGKTPLVNINVFNKPKGPIQEEFIQVIQSAEFLLTQKLNKSEYHVFGFMRSMSRWNNQISVDVKVIAASINMSDRTVKAAISKLEQYNVIKIIKSPLDARRNIYELNPESSWKGTAEERQNILERFGYQRKGMKKGINQLVLELKDDNPENAPHSFTPPLIKPNN